MTGYIFGSIQLAMDRALKPLIAFVLAEFLTRSTSSAVKPARFVTPTSEQRSVRVKIAMTVAPSRSSETSRVHIRALSDSAIHRPTRGGCIDRCDFGSSLICFGVSTEASKQGRRQVPKNVRLLRRVHPEFPRCCEAAVQKPDSDVFWIVTGLSEKRTS